MRARMERSWAGWLSALLAVLTCPHDWETQTQRPTASSALGAHSGGLDVEACAATRERLIRRQVRDRGGLLVEPAVELVAVCRASSRLVLELLSWLLFARSIEQLVDVRVRSFRCRGVLSSGAAELVGGDHQRGHEVLRGRRVKICRDSGGRFWWVRGLRSLGCALLLAPLRATGVAVDDGHCLSAVDVGGGIPVV
jgi:hypothetical protein